MNYQTSNDFLPVGSIVSIRFNYGLKVMITGYGPKEDKTNKIYDYIGVVYPYGFDSYDSTIVFDREVIKKIYFIGYETEDSKNACEDVKEILNRIKQTKKQD